MVTVHSPLSDAGDLGFWGNELSRQWLHHITSFTLCSPKIQPPMQWWSWSGVVCHLTVAFLQRVLQVGWQVRPLALEDDRNLYHHTTSIPRIYSMTYGMVYWHLNMFILKYYNKPLDSFWKKYSLCRDPLKWTWPKWIGEGCLHLQWRWTGRYPPGYG